MNYVCLNGEIVDATKPVLMADNRAFRYGEGLFETMKMIKGKIPLLAYHHTRLRAGLDMLQLNPPSSFSAEILISQTSHLCKKNHCEELARIRLTVFGGNGMINKGDNGFQYLIEAGVADEKTNHLNEKGFTIGLYMEARKAFDKLSGLKSANYLPYLMAAKHSYKNGLDECLVLNMYDRIAESSIANLFLVMGQQIITPPLTEACVNGVMRRYLLDKLDNAEYEVLQKPVTEQDIEKADELFLTNAIYGIRWVKRFRDKEYEKSVTEKIYDRFIKPIWQ